MAKLLSILMQRSDPSLPWGFTLREGVVQEVTSGSLAALHLTAGDIILEIDNRNAQKMQKEEQETIIEGPSKTLDLLILKDPEGPRSKMDLKVNPQSKSSLGLRDTYFCESPEPHVKECARQERRVSTSKNLECSRLSRRDLQKIKEEEWERVCTKTPDNNDCIPKDPIDMHDDIDLELGKLDGRNSQAKCDTWKYQSNEQGEKDNKISIEENPDFKTQYDYLKSCGTKHNLNVLRDKHVRKYFEGNDERLDDALFDYDSLSENELNEQQGDITFWTVSPVTELFDSLENLNCNEEDREFGSKEPPFHPSSYAQQPISKRGTESHHPSNSPFREPLRRNDQTRLKKQREQWRRSWHDDVLGSTHISSRTKDNTNLQPRLKQIFTVVDKYYSCTEKIKNVEKSEKMNVSKETETSIKLLGNGEEEVTTKKKKNKEYRLENKDLAGNSPKENSKSLNYTKQSENVTINGKNEFSDKTEHTSKEVDRLPRTDLSNDKEQHQNIVARPTPQKADNCDHTVGKDEPRMSVYNGNDVNEKQTNDFQISAFMPVKKRYSIYHSSVENRDEIPLTSFDHSKNDVPRSLSMNPKFHKPFYWPPSNVIDTKEMNNDFNQMEYNPERQPSELRRVRSGSLDRSHGVIPNSNDHSSPSSGYSSLPYSCSPPESPSQKSFLRKPSDFLRDSVKGRAKLNRPSSLCIPLSSYQDFKLKDYTCKEGNPYWEKKNSPKAFHPQDISDSNSSNNRKDILPSSKEGNEPICMNKGMSTSVLNQSTNTPNEANGESNFRDEVDSLPTNSTNNLAENILRPNFRTQPIPKEDQSPYEDSSHQPINKERRFSNLVSPRPYFMNNVTNDDEQRFYSSFW